MSMSKDDNSLVALVYEAEREYISNGPRSTTPGEAWRALRDVAAGLDDASRELDHDRAALTNEVSPIGRALAAIRLAREHGLELQSATWDGTEEWRLTFYLPYGVSPPPNPKLASRLIVDDEEK